MIWFDQLRKQKIFIGQEAILDARNFTMEGREKKSLRNAMNALQKKGYVTAIYRAPLQKSFVEKLRQVSDEWLQAYEKKNRFFPRECLMQKN